MKEFLSSQLFSVLVGACIALIASLVVSKRTYTNSLDEEIAKERISAYKRINQLVSQLNHSLSPKNSPSIPDECYLGYIQTPEVEYHMSYCFPTVFANFSKFHAFKGDYSIILNDNRIFLDQAVMNKLCFLDSYLSKIWHLANGKNDEFLNMLGFVLINEIDDMCRRIEDDIQAFFSTGKKRTQKSNLKYTYKYKFEHMKETQLYTLQLDKMNIEHFGDFPLCINCKFHKKCPLKSLSGNASPEEMYGG